MPEAYEPGDDSFMMLKAASSWLERNAKVGMKILDMGTGSGYIIANIKEWLDCRGLRAELWASDVDETRLPDGIRFVRSDLFSSIRGTFNLILFNPPYLPESGEDRYLGEQGRKQLVGGRKGNELSLRFLGQLPAHLRPGGVCLLLVSSVSRPEEIREKAKGLGLRVKPVMTEGFPFERLTVFLITHPK